MDQRLPSRLQIMALLMVSGLIFLLGCGAQTEDRADTAADPASYLPSSLSDGSLEKISDVRRFVGDSLWEYINGGAELYHQYGFEVVVTADYRARDEELVADIYQFESKEGAYGLYAAMRPPDAETVPIGIQGFRSSTSLTFTSGFHVVRVTAYESADSTITCMTRLARSIEDVLPDLHERPATFSLLPADSLISNTDRILAESFLGQAFLTDFYRQDYAVNGDTITLFLTALGSGPKFTQWGAAVSINAEMTAEAGTLPFDEEQAAVTETYYGPVLFGLRGDHLVGVINYSPDASGFVNSWLTSLK